MAYPTIDHALAEEPKLWAWLAELPCPECKGKGFPRPQTFAGGECFRCHGLGRAFPWASKPCPAGHGNFALHDCPDKCKGSGRVPKAVGLEELLEHDLRSVGQYGETGLYWAKTHASGEEVAAEGETPTLAALRAKVAQAQAGMP